MKSTIKRLLFGLLSSLLLAAGFVRAADRFDPITKDLGAVNSTATSATPDTVEPCWADENITRR